MVEIHTKQVQSFGEALLVIIAYVVIGYIMQRVGYLIPEWYSYTELKHTSSAYTKQQFITWFRDQYKQLLIFIPIKYIGNFLYYIVLPLQYFQILSTSLNAYQSVMNKNNGLFFYQNLIICISAKGFLLIIAALFSTCLFYSRKRNSRQQTGILTNEADVTAYMYKYRQCLLHDHPLAKLCVFGLFLTSTYDIAIGIPLIESIYPFDESEDIDKTDYTQYIYLYNLIQLFLIVPFCLLLLDIAVLSVQKKYRKLREQETIMKQTMAFEREELINEFNKTQQKQSETVQYHDNDDDDDDDDDDGIQSDNNISDDVQMSPNPLSPIQHNTFDTENRDIMMSEDEEDEYEEDEYGHNARQKSAALNVFLSSINKVQVVNQELQQQQEMQRMSRLNKLANLPLQHRSTSTTSPKESTGPNSPDDRDYDAMITPQNTDHSMYNTPYEPQGILNAENELIERHQKKSSMGSRKNINKKNSKNIKNDGIRKRKQSKNKMDETETIPLNTANSTRTRDLAKTIVSTVSVAPLKRKTNGKMTVCKRFMAKIILNPIILASIAALICRALISDKILLNMEPYLNNVSSIYEFLALYIVGCLLAVFFEQRLNIFKFAAQNHQDKKSKILYRINQHLNRNSYQTVPQRPNTLVINAGDNDEKQDDIHHDSYDFDVFTPNLPEYDDEEQNIFETALRARSETNIWTYTQSATGGIHFRQKTITTTEIEDMMKQELGNDDNNNNNNNNNNTAMINRQSTNISQASTTTPSSISLMNTDNVMMWWWALSFVLFRYLVSSLSYRFISFAIYTKLPYTYNNNNNIDTPKQSEMEVMNYLYGTLTPNLLSLIIAMKYNIYISFITVSYMISIILYPIIVFCGLLLFTTVPFDALQESVRVVIFSVQLCSIISAFIILIFWYGFNHWKTYPITIFMAILVLDVAYNTSYFGCEYIEYYSIHKDDPTYIILIVYFFRQWLRLLLLSAAFQSCLLISNYSVLKKELKTYHKIIQPLIFILSILISLLLWFIRHDAKFTIDLTWKYPFNSFAINYNLKCQYSSTVQLQTDLIIQSLYTLLLAIMFWYILRKRYQYEISEIIYDGHSKKERSILFQTFFCCYLKCCNCCGNRYKRNKKKRKKYREKKVKFDERVNKDTNDKKEPLLSTEYIPPQQKRINQHEDKQQYEYKHTISDTNQTIKSPQIELSNDTKQQQQQQENTKSDDIHNSLKLQSLLQQSMSLEWNINDSELNILNEDDADGLPQILMVDGKSIEIRSDFHSGGDINTKTTKTTKTTISTQQDDDYMNIENIENIDNNIKNVIDIEYVYEARIDCDPSSLEIYYQFDYYAYILIIFCVALIGFIANIVFIIFLLHSDLEKETKNSRVLELLMLLSVFQHGQTFFISILFLSTKPIKRLTKNIWKRLKIRCQLISQNIKDKVDDDGHDTFGEDENGINDEDVSNLMDKNNQMNQIKNVILPRQFYHRLPILW